MPISEQQPVCWFVARTRYGQELKIKKMLSDLSVEHFIPSRLEIKIYSGHKRKVEKPLINNLVFVRATKSDACQLVNYRGVPCKYIIDHNTRTLLTVPDKQLDDFRRVVECTLEEAGIAEEPMEVGDRVQVVCGDLAGVEGRVARIKNKTFIVVDLCGLLQAKAVLPAAWLLKR